MSELSEFDCGEWILEEEDLCDYNGEECFGDKLFCEECPVLTGDWGEGERKNPFSLDNWSLFWEKLTLWEA